jgi:hypothetical protein
LAWAASGHAILYGGAAGNIDRDVLNILILSIGALAFYFSERWTVVVGGRDVGWVAAGLIVLSAELLLYLEWNFVGPVLLLAIIIATAAGRALTGGENADHADHGKWRWLRASMARAEWRAFALVIGANLLAMAALYSQVGPWFRIARNTVASGGGGVINELQGIWARGFLDFANFHFLLIPLVIGLYLTLRRKDSASVFFFSWFLILVVLSMFSSRVLIYAVPAACVLAGVGLGHLWEWGGWTSARPLVNRAAVGGLLVLTVVFSFMMVVFILGTPKMTLDDDWRDALAHIRDNSAEDAAVMAWWDYGYWILDVAQRRPVADNGYYGWDITMMADLRSAYLTTEAEETAQVMDKYGADFLIFSQLDDPPIIMSWPFRPTSEEGEVPSFPEDSMAARSLARGFESEGGLELWYTAPDSGEPQVVVLRRAEPE